MDDYKTKVNLVYPTSTRVCVWLIHGKNKQIPIWFKVKAYARVFVAQQDIPRHKPLLTSTFACQERNIAGLKTSPALKPDHGTWLTSPMVRGDILLESKLMQPPLVIQGQTIKLRVNNQHLTITMDMIAQADARLGDQISVKNPQNNQVFQAKIIGKEQAELSS